MTHEITKPSKVLNKNGLLVQEGWARRPYLHFNRENIPLGWHRLKEWDNYMVFNPECGITLLIGEIGVATLITITIHDIKNQKLTSGIALKFFTKGLGFGKYFLGNSLEEGIAEFSNRTLWIKLNVKKDYRIISLNYPKFGGVGLKGAIKIYTNHKKESFAAAVTYPKSRYGFNYNHKIIGMKVKGKFQWGNRTLEYKPDTPNCYCTLDWGRGLYPYKTTWVWGSGAGIINGKELEFTVGAAVEGTKNFTENMLCYDGKVQKLDKVYLKRGNLPYSPWVFTSNDGRFEMKMIPMLYNLDRLPLIILSAKGHIAYGWFIGTITLDDGTILEVKGKELYGHAEDCLWRW